MEIEDLEKFLVIAATENLQRSADRLDTTPGGLSKVLRRLEKALNTRLFDRVGKQIRLNDAGRRLQGRAAEITAIARQVQAELNGLGNLPECRVAAPAVIQLTWATSIQRELTERHPNARLSFTSAYESLALSMLVRGEVDLAIITGAILGQVPTQITTCMLGVETLCIVAGPGHPLASGQWSKSGVSIEVLQQYPFAAPRISPFCGEERGIGSDGWGENLPARKLQVIVNDYGVLSRLIKTGQFLALLPEALVEDVGGAKIKVVGEFVEPQEELFIAWRGGHKGWLDDLALALSGEEGLK
ncbi:LysR substrate-binding domain-containing protein [Microbulbifer sp. CnH-101-G]|uniref:LysR family transcriptional regulator n=1 Tax=Microbulbifer sp. CnH-101-G TaxID=3243393 RepID=UPI00403948E4